MGEAHTVTLEPHGITPPPLVLPPPAGELTVAIHLNRAAQFNPDELHIPPLRIAALWVFASISADKSVWGLWGNLLEDRLGSIFKHPRHAAG